MLGQLAVDVKVPPVVILNIDACDSDFLFFIYTWKNRLNISLRGDLLNSTSIHALQIAILTPPPNTWLFAEQILAASLDDRGKWELRLGTEVINGILEWGAVFNSFYELKTREDSLRANMRLGCMLWIRKILRSVWPWWQWSKRGWLSHWQSQWSERTTCIYFDQSAERTVRA